MNFKSFAIIFLILLALVFSVGAISAADDNITALETPNNEIDAEIVSKDVQVVTKSQNVVNEDVKKTGETISKPKIKTKVEADQIAVIYKKNNKFKIKVEDLRDDDIPISNVKLNVNIDGKIYNVKTNYYGVAKINTKSLKVGTHKVIITSADDNYDISKTSKIFVGKQHTATLRSTAMKVLKKGDVVKLRVINDFDEKEVKVILKKAKFTKILKAKFYVKDRYTGQVLVKTDRAEFDDYRWELPEEDFSNRYALVKVKVYYISTK
jgi:hypothetical protein